jgi:hypothetical protein
MRKIDDPDLQAMRERNGAKDSTEWRTTFEAIRAQFLAKHALPEDFLFHKDPALLVLWQEEYRNHGERWCGSCRGYHTPTAEHPHHALCDSLHAPMPDGFHFDYRGWKFTPPFICMACGIEICFRQWAFSRTCGPCDVSDSKTRRLLYLKCFAGPHEKLPTWKSDGPHRNIQERDFIDPAKRLNYPLMRMRTPPTPKPLPPRRKWR